MRNLPQRMRGGPARPGESARPGEPARPLRVVLVAPGNPQRAVGGFSIRWRNLRAALGRFADVSFHALDSAGSGAGQAPARGGYGIDVDATAMRALARSLAASSPDLVVFTELRMHKFLAEVAALGRYQTVLDLHNFEYGLKRQLRSAAPAGSWWQRHYTDEYCRMVGEVERAAMLAAGQVWMCSETDKTQAAAIYGPHIARRVHVVPNAVDASGAVLSKDAVSARPERVVFMGKLDYLPNLLAARTLIEDIAPLLHATRPELTVLLAGAYDRREFADLPMPPNVRFAGRFPEVSQILRRAMLVVPLGIGGGSRYKILDAFLEGSAVVSTPKGAEGLAVSDRTHLLLARRPREFAAAVGDLVEDAGLRWDLAARAYDLVRARYSVGAMSAAAYAAIEAGS